MRLIATPALAHAVSKGGGLGFIGAGTDMSKLYLWLSGAFDKSIMDPVAYCPETVLPVGVGIITHAASLITFKQALKDHVRRDRRPPPAAVWFFAPEDPQASDLRPWIDAVREICTPPAVNSFASTQDRSLSYPHIWYQAGSVREVIAAITTNGTSAINPSAPGRQGIDVLVIQSSDAGGHGLNYGAGLTSLIPETLDAIDTEVASGTVPAAACPHILAGGGIAEGRGAAAAIAAGAHGIVMGTRYLATPEAVIARGYQNEVIRANDGGQTTVRSGLYDTLRGTRHWPSRFGGRGVINRTWTDSAEGMNSDENERLYKEVEKTAGDKGWGPDGRMTTYAGTAVGLVNEIRDAAKVTEEIRDDCSSILKSVSSRL